MASKYITIVRGGGLVKVPFMKPQAPRNLSTWLRAAATAASFARASHFTFRFGGCWHIVSTTTKLTLRSFPETAEEAAEVYLYHLVGRI